MPETRPRSAGYPTSPASSGPRSAPTHAPSPPRSGPGSRTALCLWLPTFELRLELVRSPELDATSVALLSAEGGSRRTLWQVSERAWKAGVRPGQLVSQAVSLCPSLTLLEPDPAHYDAARDALLEVLLDLTPVVEPASGDRGKAFLGMDGMGRLYGSPLNQIRRVLRSLVRVLPPTLVASIRVGHAPGTFGAWVAAVGSGPGEPVVVSEEELPGFLARQPVSALPVDETMLRRLERLQVRTLGALARLPEPALVAQFGEEGRRARGWATGERVDPVRPLRRPRPIRVSLDFPAPAGRIETLYGALDRLLERALSRPARRGRSVAGLRMAARLEGGGSWTAEHVLKEPTADRETLARVLRSRLEMRPPQGAVESLRLEIDRFGPATRQAGLFDRSEAGVRDAGGADLTDGEVPGSLKDAVKELKLRLGHSPLYRVVEVDPWSRIPERRHALLSFDP